MRRIYDQAEDVLIWLPVEVPNQTRNRDERRTVTPSSWESWSAQREKYIALGDSLNPAYTLGNVAYLS